MKRIILLWMFLLISGATAFSQNVGVRAIVGGGTTIRTKGQFDNGMGGIEEREIGNTDYSRSGWEALVEVHALDSPMSTMFELGHATGFRDWDDADVISETYIRFLEGIILGRNRLQLALYPLAGGICFGGETYLMYTPEATLSFYITNRLAIQAAAVYQGTPLWWVGNIQEGAVTRYGTTALSLGLTFTL